eukprot:642976-Pelagomonas_calceolata.AAC.8
MPERCAPCTLAITFVRVPPVAGIKASCGDLWSKNSDRLMTGGMCAPSVPPSGWHQVGDAVLGVHSMKGSARSRVIYRHLNSNKLIMLQIPPTPGSGGNRKGSNSSRITTPGVKVRGAGLLEVTCSSLSIALVHDSGSSSSSSSSSIAGCGRMTDPISLRGSANI